jgi:thiosulfate reductase cytochrome b subunit
MPMLQGMTATSFIDETRSGHARWVRVSHWIVAASVLTLGLTGFIILMAHPRLYWGNVGNDLTPALVELPLGRNHWHTTWDTPVPFFSGSGSPVTAVRTYDILNENSWGRSLHFLAAWLLVLSAGFYALASLLTGHFRRDLLPRLTDLKPRALLRSLSSRRAHRAARPGPPYNALQKCAYIGVVFIALPVMALTGMTMSPAIAAAYPFLLDVFGGSQSARTLHFGMFCLLTLFLVGHVLMVILSGFKRQLRAMTLGSHP